MEPGYSNMATRNAWQIRVELKRIRPPIWRRVLVADRTTLPRLHEVIQDAFGWKDYHLHEFQINGARFGDPENDEYGELGLLDEYNVKLRDLGLKQGDRFGYVYDFGDNWEHTLRVEEIRVVDEHLRFPACLDGGRACPPEDVGGIGGYAEFLEALADSSHPRHAEYLSWAGGDFDPERFDLKEANRRLRRGQSLRRVSAWSEMPEDREKPQAMPVATEEQEAAARALPLRRDVETMLTYLREHKVTGTQSTGNLPLKAVAEISSGFVTPPVLEMRLGSLVHRFRSEEEVQPVFFAHLLARGADLITGGPGRLWRLTSRGESFPTEAAFAQVCALLRAWWYQVDWQLPLSYRLFAEEHAAVLPRLVRSMMEELPAGEPLQFEPFVDRLIAAAKWSWEQPEPYDIRAAIGSAVQSMVVDPLAEFGILSAQREREALQSFSLTDFGRSLLQFL